MIQEVYCSFEVSKLLKEKGFNESTQLVWYEHLPSANAAHNSEIGKPKRDYFYWSEEEERNSPWTNDCPVPPYISGEVYSCPTHQMAMAWLRKKGLHINISYRGLPPYNHFLYYWNIVEDEYIESSEGTYEEAVEAALKYTLENLI